MFIKFNFKAFRKWLKQLLMVDVLLQRKGYYILTPSFFASQKILSCKTGKIITLHVRDVVDYFCMLQIYKSEHYKLDKFHHHNGMLEHYESILKTGKTPLIIDCGANVGFSALYFAEKFPKAKVIAVEPENNNYAQIIKNCRHKPLIIPMLAGIASENKQGSVVDIGRGNWGFTVEEDVNGDCRLIAIPFIIETHKDTVPFICKIDIEGFEQELFSKNTDWLDLFDLVVIEPHDGHFPKTANSKNFLATISKYDRDFYFKHENIYSFSNKAYP